MIEMSTLTGTRPHLAYAMHYCDRGSDLYRTPEEEIARRWTAHLLATYPDRLSLEDVAEVPGTRPVLATTARIYPEVTSWNSSTGLPNRVVDDLPARTGAPVPADITLA